MWKQRLVRYLIDPRYKRVHLAIIALALVLHLSLHYSTYVPALRGPLGTLPYFRLHVLHEAEFLLIVTYAGVVLGLRAGIAAVAITGVTSIPFILTPYIFGREPDANEIRDLALQVGFILIMGLMMVLLYDRDQRRRRAEQDKEALREMDRMRNNFMSMAAHELRTPMTTVMGFADLLTAREISHDQRVEWAGHIGAQAKRLNNLIEELLSVSRIAAGKLQVDLQAQSVETIAEAALVSVGYMPSHPIYLDIPNNLPQVSADRDKLLQVLVNLLSNAIKYSPQGGAIWLSAREAFDGHIRIDVQDEGLGISGEDQAKLFTGFYRVQSPETEKIPGTGLGLSIVRSLIELMGGRVNVESELGKGSTFSVALPIWREQASATPSAAPSPQAA